MGETLAADMALMSFPTPDSYQWIRSDGNVDIDIDGATGSSYMLTDGDEGKAIKVRVVFTAWRVSRVSDPSPVVTAALTEALVPPTKPENLRRGSD